MKYANGCKATCKPSAKAGETSSIEEGFEAVQAAQQKAAEVFAQEPRAALQTQANATPDLVLNTLAE